MSNKYVLIESNQPAKGESIPNHIIHRIAGDIEIQPYAVLLASTMTKIFPTTEFTLVALDKLASDADELVELSPYELNLRFNRAILSPTTRRFVPGKSFVSVKQMTNSY